MNILIIGANGFIGSHLSHAILGQTEWCVFAIDINSHYLNELRDHPRFTFIEGDISINQEWIENHIKDRFFYNEPVSMASQLSRVSN